MWTVLLGNLNDVKMGPNECETGVLNGRELETKLFVPTDLTADCVVCQR